MIDRMDKIATLLKRELSTILMSYINDPRVQHVTITNVDVARDLKTAKVCCALNVPEEQKLSILRGLTSAGGYMRGELARRVSMKFIPRLSFVEDAKEDERNKIDDIFARIERENMAPKDKKDYIPDAGMMEAILQVIRENKRFVLTSHVNPEGDSIGSQLALYHALKALGKEAYMVDSDRVPDNLRFLIGTEEVMSSIPVSDYVLFVLDCPTLERTGKVGNDISRTKFIVNIDHHISNTAFGSINWVEPSASSVGEMLYHLIKKSGVGFIREINEAIYTAIITDTGMFNYDNTTKTTHYAAGDLVGSGVDTVYIHTSVYENKSQKEIRLLGRALATLRFEENGQIAVIFLTRQMLIDEDVEHISTDEFINYPRAVKGVEVAVFIKQAVRDDSAVNVSLRSTGKVDVNKIASRLGGGGHIMASGCRLEAPLEDAYRIVIDEIKKDMV